jgi:hypothetical protein
MSSKVLDRISALLAQAERTNNEAEARAYFEKAQSLAATTSIDLATARLHTKNKETREAPERRQIKIGAAGQRYLADRVELFDAIARPNGVKLDIAMNSTYVWAYGFPSDIDMVEALYASLVIQMTREGDAYLKRGEHKTLGVHGAVARRSFYTGFRGEIGRRIRTINETAKSEAEAEDLVVGTSPIAPTTSDQPSTAELALIQRDVEVRDYYSQTSTARGTWGGARISNYSSGAATSGRTAGERARIGSQPALSGSRTAVSA